MGAMGPPIQTAGFQAPLPVSYMQNSLSDNDVMRVALKVNAMLMDEIDTLVTLKVNEATNQMKNDTKGLQEENAKLRNDIDKLEKKCKTNIDDLEQYSRRQSYESVVFKKKIYSFRLNDGTILNLTY